MKLLNYALLNIALALSFCANAQSWNQKADMPSAREGTVCFSINGKVYWGGTSTYQANALSDFYEYDPATDKWTQLGNMPEERLYGVSFTINGKGYAGLGKQSGGGFSNYHQSLFEYDPGTDKWAQKASIPAPYGLVSSTVFVVNGKAYVLGGTNANSASYGTLYEYDPATDQWATKSPYPLTNQGNNWVRQPMTFSTGNKGYVIGGEIRKAVGLGSEYTKKCFAYEPSTDTWTPIADFMGDGRAAGSAFAINGMGYCGLGYSKDPSFNNTYYKNIFSYNPGNDQWVSVGNFPGDERVLASATVINNKGYVGGGSRHQTGYYKDWYEISIPTSINKLNSNHNKLLFYPNPTNGIITIAGVKKNYNYTIKNIQGQTVMNGILSTSNDDINLSSQPTGTYFIQIQGEQKSIWQKVVKQ